MPVSNTGSPLGMGIGQGLETLAQMLTQRQQLQQQQSNFDADLQLKRQQLAASSQEAQMKMYQTIMEQQQARNTAFSNQVEKQVGQAPISYQGADGQWQNPTPIDPTLAANAKATGNDSSLQTLQGIPLLGGGFSGSGTQMMDSPLATIRAATPDQALTHQDLLARMAQTQALQKSEAAATADKQAHDAAMQDLQTTYDNIMKTNPNAKADWIAQQLTMANKGRLTGNWLEAFPDVTHKLQLQQQEALKQTPPGTAGNPMFGSIGQGMPQGVGEAALTGLSPEDANKVKMYAGYKLPLNLTGNAGAKLMMDPNFTRLLAYIHAYNPAFDETKYQARQKFINDWTSANGTEGQANLATNRLVQHMNELVQATDALNNSDWTGVNWIENIGKSAHSNPQLSAFNTAQGKVSEEITKVWRGGAGSSADVQRNLSDVTPIKGPQGNFASELELIKLLQGQIDSQNQKYQMAMGEIPGTNPMIQNVSVLSPQAQTTMLRMIAFLGNKLNLNGGGQ